jgi:hypothetical protein
MGEPVGALVGAAVGRGCGLNDGVVVGACDGGGMGERVGALMGAADGSGAGGGKNTSSDSSRPVEQAESPKPMLTTNISGLTASPGTSLQTSMTKRCPESKKFEIAKVLLEAFSAAILPEFPLPCDSTITNMSAVARVSLLKPLARLY